MSQSLKLRLALVAALATALALGYWLGRSTNPTPAVTPEATVRPEDVELRFDAGALTLMPDGGLHLDPIESLEFESLDKLPQTR